MRIAERIPAPKTAARPLAAVADLAVVIVNYCQWHNTARLVRQLRQSDAAQSDDAAIVIVDNHSPQHPIQFQLSKQRGVTLLHNPRNLGFAQAVNRGWQQLHSEWVLLLNPDVSVDDGFLDEVQKLTDAAPETDGIIGLNLKNSDGTPQASAGPLPTLAQSLLGLLRPRARRKCRHQLAGGRVDWVTGGGMLIRRACLEQLQGLDERYFLYYEDVDFCRRAAAAGWGVRYEPGVAVTHHSPLHSRRVPAPLRLVTRHALLTYAMSAWPRWQTRLLAMLIRWEARLRSAFSATDGAVWHSLKWLPGELLRGDEYAVRTRLRHAASALDRIAAAQDREDN